MPAPPRISTQQIVNALLKWRGNVQAAADTLGMRRKSLYERAGREGLDLDAFRSGDSGKVSPITRATGMPRMTRIEGTSSHNAVPYGRKNARAPYSTEPVGRNLGHMRSAAEEDAPPIRAQEARPRAPRVTPGLQSRLRQARLDLWTKYRIEYEESDILDQFGEEAFDAWIAAKLDPKAEQPKTRKREEAK